VRPVPHLNSRLGKADSRLSSFIHFFPLLSPALPDAMSLQKRLASPALLPSRQFLVHEPMNPLNLAPSTNFGCAGMPLVQPAFPLDQPGRPVCRGQSGSMRVSAGLPCTPRKFAGERVYGERSSLPPKFLSGSWIYTLPCMVLRFVPISQFTALTFFLVNHDVLVWVVLHFYKFLFLLLLL